MLVHDEQTWTEQSKLTQAVPRPLVIFNPRGLEFLQHRSTTPLLTLGQHHESSITPFRGFCNQATSYSPKLRLHSNRASSFLKLKSPDFLSRTKLENTTLKTSQFCFYLKKPLVFIRILKLPPASKMVLLKNIKLRFCQNNYSYICEIVWVTQKNA